MSSQRTRLLVFIPAYNAARHIEWVLDRIPRDLGDIYDVEVLVVDDASQDGTPAIATRAAERLSLPYQLKVLSNPRNLGYGGNQKLGYRYAIDNGMDVVVMVHGDGQYPPEMIGNLAEPALLNGAAFGSRFATKGSALAGGMPRYKWLGNRLLTRLQNSLLGSTLTEFHSGFRAYSAETLKRIPFELNSDDFHFDTEILIQLHRLGIDVAEIAIPTHYGDETCHVNGVPYAWNVTVETAKAKAHDSGFLFERKFDVSPDSLSIYQGKTDFDSPSVRVSRKIVPRSRVLDLGCGPGFLARDISNRRECSVIGVDAKKPEDLGAFEDFLLADLDEGIPQVEGRIDVILMMDVIEHLRRPEEFVEELREFCHRKGVRQVFVSTGNVAFFLQRFALLFGQFNYAPRGILDMTHTRLFTFRTIRKLFVQSGFHVEHVDGIPAPFPLAVGRGWLSRWLLRLNNMLIRVAPRLFSFQILLTLRPREAYVKLIEYSEAHGRVQAEIGGSS